MEQLARLMEEEKEDLYRYACYRLGDEAEAEDVLQEVFLALCDKAHLLAEVENMRVHYQGQSSEAFNTQINAFKPALEEMASIVRNYITYLKNTANKYTTTEDALTDSANALRNI